MDTNDEWIQSRVGIAERRWVAGPDETLVDMAVAAGGKALAASGLAADDIDLVIVATCTACATPIPGIGPQVAHRLGIPRPGAFDLNAGLRRVLLRARRRPPTPSAPARPATRWSSASERLTDVGRPGPTGRPR